MTEMKVPEGSGAEEGRVPDCPNTSPAAHRDNQGHDAPVPLQVVGPADAVDEELRRQNELTDAQLRCIENEQKAAPLFGDKVPFEYLIMQYDETDSKDFYNKAKDLNETYEMMRCIRRDGNCFYRSMLIAEIELMFNDPAECARFVEVCSGWEDRLLALGFPPFTTNDFCDYFMTWAKRIKNREVTMQEVFQDMHDDNHANYLIIFMRLMTSGYLKEHAEDYEPFIDTGKSLQEYCAIEIEPMWKDADHLAVTGLVNAIKRGIRVEYMDQSAGPDGGWHYDFPPDQTDTPRITLLYRPGHYDVIYRR